MNPIASLSSNGFISSVEDGCDYLISCLCANNASQSNLTGKVPSTAYIIQKYSGDPRSFESAMSEMLRAVFSQHFDNVSASCVLRPYTAEELNGRNAPASEQILVIKMNFISDGRNYSLGTSLLKSNGRLSKFTTVEIL